MLGGIPYHLPWAYSVCLVWVWTWIAQHRLFAFWRSFVIQAPPKRSGARQRAGTGGYSCAHSPGERKRERERGSHFGSSPPAALLGGGQVRDTSFREGDLVTARASPSTFLSRGGRTTTSCRPERTSRQRAHSTSRLDGGVRHPNVRDSGHRPRHRDDHGGGMQIMQTRVRHLHGGDAQNARSHRSSMQTTRGNLCSFRPAERPEQNPTPRRAEERSCRYSTSGWGESKLKFNFDKTFE